MWQREINMWDGVSVEGCGKDQVIGNSDAFGRSLVHKVRSPDNCSLHPFINLNLAKNILRPRMWRHAPKYTPSVGLQTALLFLPCFYPSAKHVMSVSDHGTDTEIPSISTLPQALSEELEAINAIYGDRTIVHESDPRHNSSSSHTAIILVLPETTYSFVLTFPDAYPDSAPSVTSIASTGPHASKGAGASVRAKLQELLHQIWTPSQVCLFQLIEEARASLSLSQDDEAANTTFTITTAETALAETDTSMTFSKPATAAVAASAASAYCALIRTHHITSRKKVGKLKDAAKALSVSVVLRLGATPGVMFCEGKGKEGVEKWVEMVHGLRYKDYQLVCAAEEVQGRKVGDVVGGSLEEVATVKEFGAKMEERGVLSWWRKGMGFVGD